MPDSLDVLRDFENRYAIESFGNGDGILVDLATGSYFKLNPTAVKICEALRFATTADEASHHVSKTVMVPVAEATRMIASVEEGLSNGLTPEEAPGPIRYVNLPDGSAVLEENRHPIFSIAPEAQSLRLRASLRELTGPLVLYLQALVPKLLALLEVPVLHAAACQVDGDLLTFSGKSGAGKTTTARAFERAGGRLLSEDIVVLSLTDEVALMYVDGETYARDWARQVAPRLEKAPDREVDFSELSAAQGGATIPLAATWFIDASRRTGDDLRFQTLSVSDGALALLGNGMLATVHSRHWRSFLHRSRLIAERTQSSQVTVPDGLLHLQAAARRYIVNLAS